MIRSSGTAKMLCLDTSALIDYLEGRDSIGEFIRAQKQAPMFAPTVVLHEVFVGAARLRGEPGLEQARADLEWVEPLALTAGGAAETARVDAELHERGEPIGPLDTLIAGIVREAGGTIVTGDAHFERVAGLSVEHYDA